MMTIKTVDKNWLMRQAKSLETRFLKKFGKSLAWIPILQRFNPCVIENHLGQDTVDIDYDKYKEIRQNLIEEMELLYR